MKFGPEKAQRIKRLLEKAVALDEKKAAIGRDTAIKMIGTFKRQARLALDIRQLKPHWENKYKREDVEEALLNLEAVSNWLEDPDCDEDYDWYEVLIKAIYAVNVVTHALGTIIGKHQAGHAQAARAREKRAERPEEIALRTAIASVYKKDCCAHPWSVANQILAKVNDRQIASGYKPVLVDKVRRRLAKLPRS